MGVELELGKGLILTTNAFRAKECCGVSTNIASLAANHRAEMVRYEEVVKIDLEIVGLQRQHMRLMGAD